MKIKISKDFDALKIIDENKEVFVMNVAGLEKLEIEDMIEKYGDEVKVEAYFSYGAGRLNISFGIENFIFCVPADTVYKAKKILDI